MSEDNKIKELSTHLRSKCCLATITVVQVERYDETQEGLREPYFVNEPYCDECGEDLEWNDELDESKLPRECYNLSLKKDIDMVAKILQLGKERNRELERIVQPMKQVKKILEEI